MRGLRFLVCLALGAAALISPVASAEVSISVNKTTQRMSVSVDGVQRYSWPVSTGLAEYSTPVGAFAPSRLAKEHYSREWDDAPMPYSIFFTEAGHAIHGSTVTARLGSPASHGCIRLAPANARTLFNLVQSEGVASTRIEVTGIDPIGTAFGSREGPSLDYSRLTSFDPITDGIIADAPLDRRRERERPLRR